MEGHLPHTATPEERAPNLTMKKLWMPPRRAASLKLLGF
jgi:hypothetical protein